MVFYRIVDNELYAAGDVEKLGFEESQGLRIPDEYLEKQEFTIMRAAHGLGDWGIISAMPRLLKEKYPNCKVYLPSVKLLEKLFGNQKQNWGSFDNPFLNVEYIFKNNPYVDGFKDYISDEIFHDHYRVYDKDKKDIPLDKCEVTYIWDRLKKWKQLDKSVNLITVINKLGEFWKCKKCKF